MSNTVRQPRIVIPIQQGHMSRLLVQSGVIHRLVEAGAQVIILTKQGETGALDVPDQGIKYDKLMLYRHRLNTGWYRVFEYLFQTLLPTSSSHAREAWISQTDRIRYNVIRLFKLLGAHRFARLWIAVRHLLLPSQLTDAFWQKHQPDLVVTGTLGKLIDEYYLLRGAQRHRTRSLCTMISWDKLTTREWVLERPDMMTVWNAYNIEEAIAYHGFKPEAVRATGIPQFDLYNDPGRFASRTQFCELMGLDPKRKILFVTPQPGHVSMNVTTTVELLATMMHSGVFSKPVQILVRPHPSVYSGDIHGQGTEADLIYYESLHSNIKANRPNIAKTAGVWADTKTSEMQVLGAALYHADVVIDFYGTVSIEAAMLDTPVVYVDSYAFEKSNAEGDSIKRINYAEYVHLTHAIELGAGRVVHNESQMLDTVNLFLQNPSLDCERRRHVTEKLCYANDGASAQRLANAIMDAAMGRWV